jgi:hypothetical protein
MIWVLQSNSTRIIVGPGYLWCYWVVEFLSIPEEWKKQNTVEKISHGATAACKITLKFGFVISYLL